MLKRVDERVLATNGQSVSVNCLIEIWLCKCCNPTYSATPDFFFTDGRNLGPGLLVTRFVQITIPASAGSADRFVTVAVKPALDTNANCLFHSNSAASDAEEDSFLTDGTGISKTAGGVGIIANLDGRNQTILCAHCEMVYMGSALNSKGTMSYISLPAYNSIDGGADSSLSGKDTNITRNGPPYSRTQPVVAGSRHAMCLNGYGASSQIHMGFSGVRLAEDAAFICKVMFTGYIYGLNNSNSFAGATDHSVPHPGAAAAVRNLVNNFIEGAATSVDTHARQLVRAGVNNTRKMVGDFMHSAAAAGVHAGTALLMA